MSWAILSVVTLIDGVAFTVIDGLATCRQHTVSGRAVACGRGGRARARRQLRFLARSENPEVVATSARVPSITLLRSRSARALWVLVSPPSECSLERNGQSRARQVPTPAAMRLTARQGNYPSAILGTLRDGRARPSLTDCDQERRTDHRLLCSRSRGGGHDRLVFAKLRMTSRGIGQPKSDAQHAGGSGTRRSHGDPYPKWSEFPEFAR